MKLSLDETEFEEFDPLEEVEEDEDDEEESVSVVGHTEKETQPVMNVPEKPVLTPEEQVRDLMKKMMPQRRVLMGIVDFCREPKLASEVDEFTLALQEYNKSVYTPVILRELLEKNSCLVYLEPEDEDTVQDDDEGSVETLDELADELDDAPEEGEVEYLVVTDRPEGQWQSTPEAIAYVDEQDPVSDLQKLLAENVGYEDIIISMLRACDAENGSTAVALGELVDDEPIMQKPRRMSGYYVGRLEKIGAIVWENAWKTTDAGKAVIAQADAMDAEAAKVADDKIEVLEDTLPETVEEDSKD